MRRTTISLFAALALVGSQACGGDAEPKKDSVADSGMADMPGMQNMPGMARDSGAQADANSVGMSAAQVANGQILWAVPSPSAISGAVEVPGQLVLNEDRTARLAAPAQGRVLTVHVSPGDQINRGGRLVTLQSQEAAMAQADVAKAQAEVVSRHAGATYAKTARDRADRLLAIKAIPRQDYDRAVADDELARAALAQAEAELRRAQAGAEQLGVDPGTGAMVLRSPITGVVVTRDAAPGAVVGAGTPLVTVTDPSSLWLTVSLPEQLAGSARQGGGLRFTVAPYPTDTFTARVQSIAAAFDPATRSLPVRGVVPNPRGRLRAETFAKVWVQGASLQQAITIPESAVQRSEGKSVVYVAHPDGKGGAHMMQREVEVRVVDRGRVAVLRGLAPGEAVVIEGAYAVRAQMAKAKLPKMDMDHD